MREIPLTQGLVALVDDEDYPSLMKYKWYAHKENHTFYAQRQSQRVAGKQSVIRMHREIMGAHKGIELDHINGNGLDNRKENLRVVTRRENSQNKHTPKTSKFPGVCWHPISGKWLAQIRVGKKRHHLGLIEDEEAAYEAYKNAVKEFTGKILE